MSQFLEKIAQRTRARVAREKSGLPLVELRRRAEASPRPARDFVGAFAGPGIHVIAEIKRASPSEGAIAPLADPVRVAQGYLKGGARALSVLTEPEFFGGELEFIARIRAAEPEALILRKDFLLDEYQLLQARAAGANAVLLIVALLEPGLLRALHAQALELGLAALIEVHDEREMGSLEGLGARLVGVNNRDLKTLRISLETSGRLRPLAPKGARLIAESGLSSGADLRRLRAGGFDGFLIGTAFMRSPDPGAALAKLLEEAQ